MHPNNFIPVPGVAYDACAFPSPSPSLSACTAVCCLWEPVERAAKNYRHAYMVGPCVSPAGVDYILRTLRANPQITGLLITGADLSGTRALLITALKTSGLAAAWTADENVFNLLHDRPSIVPPIPPPDPGLQGTRRGPPARTYTGETLWSVWPRLLGDIVRHGTTSPTAYGTEQKELLAASWTFDAQATLGPPPILDASDLGGHPHDDLPVDLLPRIPSWVAQVVLPLPDIRWKASWHQTGAVWDEAGSGWGIYPLSDGHWNVRMGDANGEIALGHFNSLEAAKAAVAAELRRDPTVYALEHYALVHFLGVDARPEGVDYVYFDRLTQKDDDQLARCFTVLQEDPEQRRAVAVTWDTGTETQPSDAAGKNPPCLVMLWFRRDEDGSLYTHATFRSHDILRAGLLNAWGLCRLAEDMANNLGWPLGRLTISSLSAHVYSDGWEQAETLAQAHGRKVHEEDPRSILRIRHVPPPPPDSRYPNVCEFINCRAPVMHVETFAGGNRGWCAVHTPWSGHHEYCGKQCPEMIGASIAVDLLSPEGVTLRTIEGKTAEGVEREVLEQGWVTTLSHAAWLGRSLAAAKEK